MDPNQKLMANQDEPFSNSKSYRRLVEKLIYLTNTGLDISYAIGVVSQFIQNPHIDRWNVVTHILKYIKKATGQGLLYEGKENTQIS